MKMNVLRALLFPWLLLFVLIIAAIVSDGMNFQFLQKYTAYAWYFFWVFVAASFYANFITLSKAGIWLAHHLPSSLKRSPWGWLVRAPLAAAVAYGFFVAGQAPWAPVFWNGAVVPVVWAVCLYVVVRSLMGPILVWCSRVAFSRFSAFVLGIPVFAFVPVTAIFLGNMIFSAYKVSRPEFVMVPQVAALGDAGTLATETVAPEVQHEIPAKSDQALAFLAAVRSGGNCSEQRKAVQAALEPKTAEDTAYWALAALKCTDMKSVIGLPLLAKLMTDHAHPVVRASAIRAMMKYPREDVKRISYLIVKRVSEQEPVEVIEAAAEVLPKLGDEEAKSTVKRLTILLDSNKAGAVASKVLVQSLKREDLVAEYVAANLGADLPARRRAISMICSLPKASRKMAEPHIESVVAAIKTGDKADPAIHALACLGQPGYMAIHQEVLTPKHLEKAIAARVLAEMDVDDDEVGATLQIATKCSRDENAEVRKWCSQTLGKIGGPALPQILELLKSSDPALKEAGTNALHFFKDPVAKQELVKVRAANSGWFANQRNLQTARAIDKALEKIMSEEKPAN